MEGRKLHEKIYVDRWEKCQVSECCYFMSKLPCKTPEQLNEQWTHPIYSTNVNLKFLSNLTRHSVKRNLLNPLTFGEPKKISVADFEFTVTAIDPDTCTGKVIYHFSFDGTECLYMDGTLMSPSVFTNPYITHLGNTNIIDTIFIDSPLLELPIEIDIDLVVEQIINIFSSRKSVVSLETLGMEDLLVKIAIKGHTIHIGSKRLHLLKLLKKDTNFTKGKDVNLRVVESNTCKDLETCFRRYKDDQMHHILVSPFYSLLDIYTLRKLGVHVVRYSDNTTSTALNNILKIIKPKNLMDCNESNPKTDLLMNLLLISRTNLSLDSTYLQNAQRLSLAGALSGSSENESHNSIALVADPPKNIEHLYTDTQESFNPLATSTQKTRDDENGNLTPIENSENTNIMPIENSSLNKLVNEGDQPNNLVQDIVLHHSFESQRYLDEYQKNLYRGDNVMSQENIVVESRSNPNILSGDLSNINTTLSQGSNIIKKQNAVETSPALHATNVAEQLAVDKSSDENTSPNTNISKDSYFQNISDINTSAIDAIQSSSSKSSQSSPAVHLAKTTQNQIDKPKDPCEIENALAKIVRQVQFNVESNEVHIISNIEICSDDSQDIPSSNTTKTYPIPETEVNEMPGSIFAEVDMETRDEEYYLAHGLPQHYASSKETDSSSDSITINPEASFVPVEPGALIISEVEHLHSQLLETSDYMEGTSEDLAASEPSPSTSGLNLPIRRPCISSPSDSSSSSSSGEPIREESENQASSYSFPSTSGLNLRPCSVLLRRLNISSSSDSSSDQESFVLSEKQMMLKAKNEAISKKIEQKRDLSIFDDHEDDKLVSENGLEFLDINCIDIQQYMDSIFRFSVNLNLNHLKSKLQKNKGRKRKRN